MSVSESTINNPKKQLDFYKELLEKLEQENKQLKEQLENTKEDIVFCINNMKNEFACTDKRTNRESMVNILSESLEKIDKVIGDD